MSLREIRDLMKMAEPTPCVIIPKLPLNPGVEEEREFYGYLVEEERERFGNGKDID